MSASNDNLAFKKTLAKISEPLVGVEHEARLFLLRAADETKHPADKVRALRETVQQLQDLIAVVLRASL